MIDPRGTVVQRRLSGIGRIAAFCSAKGGVGKTLCTTVAGLVLSEQGKKVGILDLDFQGSSAHVFLGVPPRFPEEEKGLLPLFVTEGLCLMSAAAFAGNRALALRGPEVSDAILELLAVTQWGRLDFLLIDMPPGIGEEVLDLGRLIPRMEALVVSTPSTASIAVVARLLAFLAEMRIVVAGVIANMVQGDSASVQAMCSKFQVPFAGEVAFDAGIEDALGAPGRLAGSGTATALRAALHAVDLVQERRRRQ
ncbi:MAG: P-loop NTPase [Spirochaetia bacterium]|jgi:ATP-binding protein involved in chromosome partitioning